MGTGCPTPRIHSLSISLDLLYSVAFLPVAVADLAVRVCVGALAVLQALLPHSIELAPIRPRKQRDIAVMVENQYIVVMSNRS